MSPIAVRDVPTYIATIENFRTLAQKTQDEIIQPNIGREAYNLRFDERYGSVEKRQNRSTYANMSSLGTAKLIGAYRYYKNSDNTKYQLVAYDTVLKVGNDITGAFSNIKTGLVTDKHFTWITYKSLCFAFNGIDNNVVYDGSNCENMGVPIPTAPSGVDSGVAGNPNGAYKYKVSYEIDDYQEGTVSVASDTVTVVTNKITVTIPVSTNTRVTKRILYRTQASGTIYYYCATISNNTATTYTDDIADASLDTTITAPTDYGAPDPYKYSCLHGSRIFLGRNPTYKSRVIYCDVRSLTAYPDVFPANNYFDVLKDNGEELTFLGEDNYGQLVAMKPSAVVVVNTDTDDPVGWSGYNRVVSINGCISPYSAVKTNMGVIYLSRFGESKKRLMVWNGSSAQPIFEEIEPILSAIFDNRLENVVGYYHNNCYLLSYNDDSDENIYNNRLLIIDLMTGSWVIDYKNISCFCSWNSTNDWGELYTGSSDTVGLLLREDTDVSSQFDMIIDTKSELDAGTFDTACQSGGTQSAPTLAMIKATLDLQVGAQIVGSASGIVSTYDVLTDNETVAPSCTYLSPVYEVNAKSLGNIFWKAVIGTGGHVRFWVRTGNTSATCQAADWEGPYSSSGESLSAVTPAKYIQYMCKLYVEDTDNYAATYLWKDEYMVKVTFGYGSALETAIAFEYISHWDDFGWLKSIFKRTRKRMRAVRIEFERDTASGTLTFGYYRDGGSRVDKSFNFSDIDSRTGRTYAAQGFVNYNFPLGVYFNKFKYRIYNNDVEDLLVKRVSFTLSPEPYFPNL